MPFHLPPTTVPIFPSNPQGSLLEIFPLYIIYFFKFDLIQDFFAGLFFPAPVKSKVYRGEINSKPLAGIDLLWHIMTCFQEKFRSFFIACIRVR